MADTPKLPIIVHSTEGIVDGISVIDTSVDTLDNECINSSFRLGVSSVYDKVYTASATWEEGGVGAIDGSMALGFLSGAGSATIAGASGILSGVSGTLSSVSGTLSSVSGTLSSVSGTLSSVSGTLSSVSGTLSSVSSTVSSVSGTLSSVSSTVSSISGTLSSISGVASSASALSGVLLDVSDITKFVSSISATAFLNTQGAGGAPAPTPTLYGPLDCNSKKITNGGVWDCNQSKVNSLASNADETIIFRSGSVAGFDLNISETQREDFVYQHIV